MWTALLLALSAQAAVGHGSVAVWEIRARGDIPAGTALVMGEQVSVRLRNSGRFDRVVAFDDVARLVELDAMRQALDAGSGADLAEVAGALGTDFLVVGSVARLGNTAVLTLRMLDARNGALAGAVTREFPGAG